MHQRKVIKLNSLLGWYHNYNSIY